LALSGAGSVQSDFWIPLTFLRHALSVRAALPLGLLLLMGPGAGSKAQDLVGCQLVEGTLQCVPGITADPQQQIKLLRQEIAGDQRIEGAVEQRIAGLNQLLLQGEARQGALLQAMADGLAALPPSAFHWYRLAPGQSNWQLIQGASGPTYTLVAADVTYQVMVVVAVPTSNGSQRSQSQAVGPILALPGS
jgi:hypothetical protein